MAERHRRRDAGLARMDDCRPYSDARWLRSSTSHFEAARASRSTRRASRRRAGTSSTSRPGRSGRCARRRRSIRMRDGEPRRFWRLLGGVEPAARLQPLDRQLKLGIREAAPRAARARALAVVEVVLPRDLDRRRRSGRRPLRSRVVEPLPESRRELRAVERDAPLSLPNSRTAGPARHRPTLLPRFRRVGLPRRQRQRGPRMAARAITAINAAETRMNSYLELNEATRT